MLVSNKKFKIILLIIVILASALYTFTWYKSKIIFEQIVNEGLANIGKSDKITYQVVEFSHSFFNHKAVIKNFRVKSGGMTMLHEGNVIIAANILLNKVGFIASGEVLFKESSFEISNKGVTSKPAQIFAVLSADKLSYRLDYNLPFAEAVELVFASTDKHKEYAKNNLSWDDKKLDKNAKNNDISPALDYWLKHVKNFDLKAKNFKLDLVQDGKLQLDKLKFHIAVKEYNLPIVKLNLDLNLKNLDSTFNNTENPFFRLLTRFNFAGHPISLKYNGSYDILYNNSDDFKVSTKHAHSISLKDIIGDKGTAEIMSSCTKDKEQCAFDIKVNDVINTGAQYHDFVINNSIDEVVELLKGESNEKQYLGYGKEKLTEVGRLANIGLEEYKDVTLNFDFAGVVNPNKKKDEYFDSFIVRDISFKVPQFKLGIDNVSYSYNNNKPTYTGDFIIEGSDALFKDLEGYGERMKKAIAILSEAKHVEWKQDFVDNSIKLVKNILVKIANSNQNGKIVITLSNKDGSSKIGTKTDKELLAICDEEYNKLFSEDFFPSKKVKSKATAK